MTREEFTKGWALLTAQPWGRRYNGKENISESELQFKLYYSRVASYSAAAWLKVSVAYASADKWPPLNELLNSLRNSHDAIPKLTERQHDRRYVDPEEWEKTVATLTRIIGRPFVMPEPPKR